MKLCKRSVSLLLLLCFLLSLVVPAVSAATGTLGRNTASRHITCTSLSSQAQAYYTAGTYDYDTISAMRGVYSTDSWTVTQNNPVYTKLQRLMVDTHTNTSVVYSGTASGSLAYYWNYTDTVSGGSNYLLFYCDKLMGQVKNTEGYSRTGMEREHIWCKSKADYVEDSNSGGADLHHLRPSYGYINGIKSNRSFGNVTGGTACTLDGVSVFTYANNSESGVMEVNDNIKGDIARILLYVYVRWGQPNLYTSYGSNISQKLKTAGVNTSGTINGSDDGTKIIDNLDTLLEWMEIDPVDTWEMQRNDQIENIQGNRNVFIDYPEYAWIMFGMADQMPTEMDTPSGMAKQGTTSSYKITKVNVNNSSWGSAVITGDKTVTVTPSTNYYLQSATATSGTVAINGNTITVSNMTADSTVNVIFAKLPQYTVSYNVVGSISSTATCNQGSSITLPTTAANIAGYTFVGWSFAPITSEATSASLQTSSFTPTGNTTLYAVYSRVEAGAGEDTYTLVTNANQLQSGKKVVIAAKDYDYAMGAPLSSYYRAQAAVTKSGNTLTPGSDVCFFTLGKPSNDIWTLWDNTRNAYLTAYVSGSYYDLGTENTLSDNGRFTLGVASDGTASISTNRGYCNVRYVIGSYIEFACKSSATGGYDCALYIETPGTSETTYYTTSPVVPETYTVSYCILGSVSSSEDISSGNSIPLPASVAAVDGYTFVGWSDGTIELEATEAAVLTGSYTPTASVTLYAVYARTEASEGNEPTFVLSSEVPSDGDRIVIGYQSGDTWYALKNSGSTASECIGTASVVNNSTISVANASGYELNVKKYGDAFYLTNGQTNLHINKSDIKFTTSFTGNSNGLFTATLTGDDCFTLMANNNSKYLLFNADNGYFVPGDTGTALSFFKYIEGAESVTYYTTNPNGKTPCTHPSTHLENAVAATCTTAGCTGDTVCDVCGTTVSAGSVIPALSHTAVTDPAVAPTCTETGLTEGSHCSVCDTVITAQVPVAALAHNYNENGICTRCGDKLINIISASLRLDEDIDVIYTANIPESADASMSFTMNGKTLTVNNDGTNTFAFEGVNPQCMGDNISATLNVTYNGTTYSCTKADYSIRQYCVNKLADTSVTGTLRTLISDVLAYGAAAQTYMIYNTSAFVNAGDDIANPTYSVFSAVSGFAPSFEDTAVTDVRWVAAGLTLTNSVAMNFRFYAESVDGLTVNVTVNGRTQTFMASDFVAVDGKANTYEISFKGIKATEFGDNVTASFSRNSAQVGNTVSYSVNAYVCAKQADSNPALANLVKALYNYGASAAAFES